MNIFIFEEQNNKIKVRFRLRSESVCKNRQHLIASSQRLIEQGGDNGVKLNELVYLLSKNLISRYGSSFQVDNLKLPGRKFRLGNCFINAAEISRDLGYKYVEGIAVCKTSGDVICHAWNIATVKEQMMSHSRKRPIMIILELRYHFHKFVR